MRKKTFSFLFLTYFYILLANTKNKYPVSCLHLALRFARCFSCSLDLKKEERPEFFSSPKGYIEGASSEFFYSPEPRGKVQNFSKSQSLYRGEELGIFLSPKVYVVGGVPTYFQLISSYSFIFPTYFFLFTCHIFLHFLHILLHIPSYFPHREERLGIFVSHPKAYIEEAVRRVTPRSSLRSVFRQQAVFEWGSRLGYPLKRVVGWVMEFVGGILHSSELRIEVHDQEHPMPKSSAAGLGSKQQMDWVTVLRLRSQERHNISRGLCYFPGPSLM